MPAPGLRTVGIGPLRFDRHPLADAGRVDARAHVDDRAGGLVAEHQGPLDDEVADAAVPVVVRVRPADPHRGDPNQHVTGVGTRHGPFVHLDPAGFDEDCGPHEGAR